MRGCEVEQNKPGDLRPLNPSPTPPEIGAPSPLYPCTAFDTAGEVPHSVSLHGKQLKTRTRLGTAYVCFILRPLREHVPNTAHRPQTCASSRDPHIISYQGGDHASLRVQHFSITPGGATPQVRRRHVQPQKWPLGGAWSVHHPRGVFRRFPSCFWASQAKGSNFHLDLGHFFLAPPIQKCAPGSGFRVSYPQIFSRRAHAAHCAAVARSISASTYF